MSIKDKGNQYFKKAQYEKAIKCYEQYVQGVHQDNKQAYCNMSLCYFKLQQYQQSIEAGQSALQQDKYFAKAYYRLVNAYKQIPGRQYQVFINSALFLKNFNTLDQQRQKVSTIFNEYRQKLRFNKITNAKKININRKVIDTILQAQQNYQPENLSNPQIYKEYEHWSKNQLQQKIKWDQIVKTTYHNYGYGINLAYFYLNQIENSNKREEVIQKIQMLKQQEDNKKKIKKIAPLESSNQIINNQNIIINPKQNELVYSNTPIPINIQKVLQANQQEKLGLIQPEDKVTTPELNQIISIPAIDMIPQVNTNQQLLNSKQIPQKQYILNMYELYFHKLQASRDIFSDLYNGIVTLLKSKQSYLTKKEVLCSLKGKKDLQFVFKSYTPKQKKEIKQLLSVNKIEDIFIFGNTSK